MNAAAMPDSGARRRALDPARSFIVQAPAGSGKTELLIQRYLRLLALRGASRGDHRHHLHPQGRGRDARARAGGAGARRVPAQAPASEHDRTTLELAAAALARDTAAGWGVTDNPARLRIQTIDSLCAALTRQMPMLSRFGSQPESIEDAPELYLEAARATIELVESDEAVAQDVERLLTHLDNDVGRIEGLLAEMLRRRDHWLRHVHGRERAELEAALQSERRGVLERVRGLLPAEARAEWKAIAEYRLCQPRSAGRSRTASRTGRARPPVPDQEDQWRRRLTKNQGFPAGKPAQPWKERALALFDELRSARRVPRRARRHARAAAGASTAMSSGRCWARSRGCCRARPGS